MKNINSILSNLTAFNGVGDGFHQCDLKMLRNKLKTINYNLIEREQDSTVYLKHEDGTIIETNWTILEGFNVANFNLL